MKLFRLIRDPYGELATTGFLLFANHVLHTLERPWLPTAPGGKPRESCVPAGRYSLRRHRRPSSGDEVVALINPGLGVYYLDEDRPNECGRYMILCHSANRVAELAGCIAPGLQRSVTDAGPIVLQSRKAMSILMDYLGQDEGQLIIEETFTDVGET